MPDAAPALLALNLGSSGLKAASFSLPTDASGEPAAPQPIEWIAIEARADHAPAGQFAGHLLEEAAQRLASTGVAPKVVAHRIVHGADRPGPVELTPQIMAELQGLSALAPLHQPPALALVRAAMQRWPQARQVAVFDTSWHQAMPEVHRMFAIPHSLYLRGVKRFGFHGLAFQSAMRQLATLAPALARARLVLVHLGGGSSVSAVFDGRCVNTSMGMTPLDGVPMATRPGSLDPGVLLYLQRELGMSPERIDQLLWHECGLQGLSGESSDLRRLLASDSEGARRAIDAYVTGVVQSIAAMAACVHGVDAVVFSGGIGAHAAGIRARVSAELQWLGLVFDPRLNEAGARELSAAYASVRSFALQVDEELEMALAAAHSICGGASGFREARPPARRDGPA